MLLAFLLAGGGQQVVGQVHEQAQVAGGMFAERLDQAKGSAAWDCRRL